MEEPELKQIDILIKQKEEAFQKALTNNVESSILTYMKKDIDLFREKRAEIFSKVKKSTL